MCSVVQLHSLRVKFSLFSFCFVCLFFSEMFFDPRYDICFCTECHAARGDNLYYFRGKPPKDYGIPIGWCRFGLMLVERVMSVYHKTSKSQSFGQVHNIAKHSSVHFQCFSVVFLDDVVGKFMLLKFSTLKNFVGVMNFFWLSHWQSSVS